MGYDFVTWGAIACVLSALGGGLSWLAFRRRGLASGLRGLAWSILPVAAWLTGTLRLVAHLAGNVVDWAVGLVFSPVVWLGIVLAGVAVVLFGVSGTMKARGVGTRQRRPRAVTGTPPAAPAKETGLEGMDDIEAILKKHGIS
ncbi:MAG TPA: hypothetical protein VFR99_10015 [Marmoricola sp.]|nr:hypothetical protein [Marmoricola sp.]